jgi:hypothetical protein
VFVELPPGVGSNIVFNGGGGMADGGFLLPASTNVALPPENWTRVATNAFDGVGGFQFTNESDPNAPRQFYPLQLP